MPFLWSLATEHSYCELGNVLGYSFAIQSCMLSGKYPEETNHWLPYFYSPQESPIMHKAFGKIGAILPIDRLPSLRYLTVSQTRRFFLPRSVHIDNVPLDIIDRLSVYPYYYMSEMPFFSDLRKILREKRQAILTFVGPPKIRTHLYEVLLKYIRASNHEKEFVIVYDDALDGLGHEFGPNSIEYLRYAQFLDRTLLRVYQQLGKCRGKDLVFLVFSDHAQCEQTRSFDLLLELEKKSLHFADDYFCFIDATMALFWFQNEVVEEKILKVLDKSRIGKIIDDDLKKQYHIRFSDKRFGEMVFVLKLGGTFFPNFFSPFGTMKGLHGYLPEESVQKSFLISNRKSSYNLSHIKDFRNLLLSTSAFGI